jgi:hypothetical protein
MPSISRPAAQVPPGGTAGGSKVSLVLTVHEGNHVPANFGVGGRYPLTVAELPRVGVGVRPERNFAPVQPIEVATGQAATAEVRDRQLELSSSVGESAHPEDLGRSSPHRRLCSSGTPPPARRHADAWPSTFRVPDNRALGHDHNDGHRVAAPLVMSSSGERPLGGRRMTDAGIHACATWPIQSGAIRASCTPPGCKRGQGRYSDPLIGALPLAFSGGCAHAIDRLARAPEISSRGSLIGSASVAPFSPRSEGRSVAARQEKT